MTNRRADRRFEDLGPVLCDHLDGAQHLSPDSAGTWHIDQHGSYFRHMMAGDPWQDPTPDTYSYPAWQNYP